MSKSETNLLRSLQNDCEKPCETILLGTVPNWLEGSLFRNGPGRYKYGNETYRHFFDGSACINKFEINKNGKIYFSNKFLASESYKKSLTNNRVFAFFGTVDLCSNVFQRVKTIFKSASTLDNANTSIYTHNSHLYALVETNFIFRLDPHTLQVIERLSITDYIKTSKTSSAHPHILPDGSWINMGINSSLPGFDFVIYPNSDDIKQTIYTSDSVKKNFKRPIENLLETSRLLTSLKSSNKMATSYFHSFGVTDNYIVFLEQSLRLDYKLIVKGLLFNKPFSDALRMDSNFDTRIHLINIQTGELVKQQFFTQPLFLFHHINAFEQIDKNGNLNIITDICAYDPNHFDINKLLYDKYFSDELLGSEQMRSTARRITIPIYESNHMPIYCSIITLNPVVFELPAINYNRYNGKQYKYVYGVSYFKKPYSIVKLNVMDNEECLEIEYNQNCLPSEPVFVESPQAQSEDDGILLIMCLNNNETNDFLQILDAKNLTEVCRANIPSDFKASFTFHGIFTKKF